ncbi:MAG: HEAT repeat domain-containing protein [Verrucomicrobiota bacterium]
MSAGLAAAALADRGTSYMPERLVAELVRVLDGESAPERVRAAMELSRASEPNSAVFEALHAGVSDDAPAVRSACLHALGQLGHEPTLPWIIDALNDPEAEVRVAACLAVAAADMGGYERLPFSDPNPNVRLAVLRALENVSPTTMLIRRLGERMDKEEQPDLRAQILRLHRLHSLSLPVDVLQGVLADGNPVERLAALRWISTQTEKLEGVDELRKAVLEQGEDGAAVLRRAAADAVAAMGPNGGTDWLTKRADDADHAVRKAVARALGQLPNKDTKSTLQQLQRDANTEVRRMASMAFARQAQREGDKVSQRIEQHAASLCADEDRAALRREGLWMLGKLRSQAGFPDILQLARQDFPPPEDEEAEFYPGDLRETRLVVWVIQRSRYQPALPQTISWFLQKKDAATQFHAARAIAETRYAAAVPALAEAVLETRVEAGVRYFYYNGIGRTAGMEALAAIANEQVLDAFNKLMRMTSPMDSEDNLAVMARTMAKHEQKEQAIKNLRRIVKVMGKVREDSQLAKAYHSIVGSKIPAESTAQPTKRYSSEFITPR